MIWTSSNLLLHTKKIKILPKVASDHNPIMWISRPRKKRFIWRMNEDLLNLEEIMEQLKKNAVEYFKYNLDKEVNIQVIWDAYKAVLREILIKLNSEQKKKK